MARPRVIDVEAALDAAAETLAAKGVAGTSVDDVAEAAGVSRATVYRCLGGKDEIVSAVIDRESRRLLDELGELVDQADNLPDLVRLVAATAAEGIDRSPVLHRLNNADRRETLPFITVDGGPLIATVVRTLDEVVRARATFAVDDRSLPIVLEEATRLFLDHLTTPRLGGGRLPPSELGARIAAMVEPLARLR